MFDNIYVLSKGGHNLYEDCPQNLRQTLIQTNIHCSEDDVPIEVLLRIASKGIDNQFVCNLSEKFKQNSITFGKNEEHFDLTKNGIKLKPKKFNFVDVWILLTRFLRIQFISNWKSLLNQLLLLFMLNMGLVLIYTEEKAINNGCIDWNKEKSCAENKEQKSILTQSANYISLTILMTYLIHISFMNNRFAEDFTTFSSEYKNSKIF